MHSAVESHGFDIWHGSWQRWLAHILELGHSESVVHSGAAKGTVNNFKYLIVTDSIISYYNIRFYSKYIICLFYLKWHKHNEFSDTYNYKLHMSIFK